MCSKIVMSEIMKHQEIYLKLIRKEKHFVIPAPHQTSAMEVPISCSAPVHRGSRKDRKEIFLNMDILDSIRSKDIWQVLGVALLLAYFGWRIYSWYLSRSENNPTFDTDYIAMELEGQPPPNLIKRMWRKIYDKPTCQQNNEIV
ncbi:hypothetical protein JTB14_008097 [Gonioctena quinquepunctata]|nr:hypothetical protein JTB14_008097 [Gonioctena quinquepunctata]